MHFSIQNACYLPYADKSFQAVIIANTLHILPNPEKALSEIFRVLTDDGILIAPNFNHKNMSLAQKINAKIMGFVGFNAYSKWSPQDYIDFLNNNKFKVTYYKSLKASFTLTYVEAKKDFT